MLEYPQEKAKTSSANVFPRSLPQAFQTRRPLIASVDPTFTVGLPFCEIPKVGSWGHPFLVTWATWIFCTSLRKKQWKCCSGIGSSSNHHVHLDEFDKSVWGLGAERSDMERVEDDNAILEGSWKKTGSIVTPTWRWWKEVFRCYKIQFQIDVENHPWP